MIRSIVAAVSNDVAEALRRNLERSEGAQGGNRVRLEPLAIWDSKFLPFEADRTNADRPLVDTGNLYQSVKVGNPEMSSLGNGGVQVNVAILSRDYGVEQARGGEFGNVYLGRTKGIRRMRNFAELTEGVDFVVKRKVRVPSRPWNDISRDDMNDIVNNAMDRIAGA
jgi:hypothetical protein